MRHESSKLGRVQGLNWDLAGGGVYLQQQEIDSQCREGDSRGLLVHWKRAPEEHAGSVRTSLWAEEQESYCLLYRISR